MVRRVAALVAVMGMANAAAAQQGSVQISSSTQVVAASDERRAGQPAFEPDLGLTVYQPTSRFGNLFLDLHGVGGDAGARLGTASVGLRDVRFGGLTWSLTGGDSASTPSLNAYAFANLFAPQVTFAGASLSGQGTRGSMTLTAGRVTMLRNIFGSDPQTIGQDLGQFQARLRPSARVELFAHASRVRSGDTHTFTSFVDAGSDAGGGVRVRPIPTLELTADAGLSRYQRRGSTVRERSVTALVGGKWALPRGWLELNAQRFSPGYFAVINTPYLDREGAFASGELVVAARLRLFGGIEAFRTNLDPEGASAASAALARALSERAFAGARLHVGGRTFVTLRAEEGDRTARPAGRFGSPYDSDTGAATAELQTSVREVTAFGRYERRENVDHANRTGTYTQQTASAQLLGRLSPRMQLFGSAMLVQQAREEGGQTFWQGGGGLQVQLPRRQLWLRGEGLFSRIDDWGVESDVPRELYTLGVSGQLTLRTAIAFDVMLDRSPQTIGRSGPWLGRSMIRVTHTMPTGAARLPSSPGASLRRRGTGSIFGFAFADWNGNGLQDAGEEPLAGVPFLYSDASAAPVILVEQGRALQVTSGKDGQFAFVNVPEGRARVSLDLGTLPVDFDPPEPAARDTEARGKPKARLAFGLVPLGSIAGAVRLEGGPDGSGGFPVEGAVLVLDHGARSEQARGGVFRFEAVRAGTHSIDLLPESLPEGMSIATAPRLEVVLDRARLHREVTFGVRLEKRREIRKVFPPKVIARARGAEPIAAPPATAERPGHRPAPRTPPARATASRVRSSPPGRQDAPAAAFPEGDITWYAIQVAATGNRARAWDLIRHLQAHGVDAYLAEDADGLAKVRVGSYRSRSEAERDLAGLKPIASGWVAHIGG